MSIDWQTVVGAIATMTAGALGVARITRRERLRHRLMQSLTLLAALPDGVSDTLRRVLLVDVHRTADKLALQQLKSMHQRRHRGISGQPLGMAVTVFTRFFTWGGVAFLVYFVLFRPAPVADAIRSIGAAIIGTGAAAKSSWAIAAGLTLTAVAAVVIGAVLLRARRTVSLEERIERILITDPQLAADLSSVAGISAAGRSRSGAVSSQRRMTHSEWTLRLRRLRSSHVTRRRT
jgi:hypothetical protein